MADVFRFGEPHPDYPVRVLNEREARGAAGIMFFFAIVAFMVAWFKGDFAPTKLVIVAFFADFFVRVLVNPRFAPSLVLARFMVRHQTPEYVGAPRKRFAWSIGLVLATAMLVLVVLNNVRGPVNILVCALCLVLLFFEAAFGICIGCKVYNLFNREKAQLCPGDVCQVKDREPIQAITASQVLLVGAYLAGLAALVPVLMPAAPAVDPSRVPAAAQTPAEEARCRVPDFAKKMGHEQMWKLHNGCS